MREAFVLNDFIKPHRPSIFGSVQSIYQRVWYNYCLNRQNYLSTFIAYMAFVRRVGSDILAVVMQRCSDSYTFQQFTLSS